MSALAQRIITSHKEAAKRAVAHLGKTRKLKLSATESLELVACVLGVANWQTLLALANDGRGPRIDDGKPTPTAATGAGWAKSDVWRLSEYFATLEGWGEHPIFTREDWQHEAENGDTSRGYWEHVEAEIERTGMMLPWERDGRFDVKLVQMAGVGVDNSEDDESWLVMDPWGYIFVPDCSSEKEAWQVAASEVQRNVAQELQLSAEDLQRYSEQDWLEATAHVHAAYSSPDAGAASEAPSDELDNGYSLLPGEMTKDSRKFSEDIALCRELSIKAEYSTEKEDEGLYWTTDEQHFFATEAEAWKAEVNRLRTEVTSAIDVAPEVWDTAYDLDTKIKLAKQFCHRPFA